METLTNLKNSPKICERGKSILQVIKSNESKNKLEKILANQNDFNDESVLSGLTKDIEEVSIT
ncbi:MAG TPA: hypothetical protein LFW21_02290 [Rickettsia endosymbiont of Pyrocoelia pectoralis]|nr:hypothetical protein [Rickettsia endosymbiont of Pyrocoelia pectoralis]